MENCAYSLKILATPLQGVKSLYTDDVLFFFSFFSKTSVSSRAKRAHENKRGGRERNLFSSYPTTTSLRWRSINPCGLYFNTRARRNKGSVNGIGSQLLQAFLLSVESSSLSSLKLIVVTEFIYVILVYLKVMEAIKSVKI